MVRADLGAAHTAEKALGLIRAGVTVRVLDRVIDPLRQEAALPPPAEGTAEAAARVAEARVVQQARGALNTRLEGEALTEAAALSSPAPRRPAI